MIRPLALALLLAAPLAAPAAAQDFPATCTWLRLSPDGFADGPCTVSYSGTGTRVTMGERTWDIRERDRQGQWASITINGVEGMRYEIDRDTYSHSTLDLNESLDVRLGGGE